MSEKVSRKRVVLPGAVAVLSGELEAELPGWEIRVGPASGGYSEVDTGAFKEVIDQSVDW